MRKIPALILLLIPLIVQAAVIGVKTPNVELADGRKLKNFVIISVLENSVTAKWDGGRGSISRFDLPSDLRASVDLEYPKRPVANEATAGPTESTLPELVYPDIPEPPALTETQGRERTIAGQVFVTTAGGSNIKLGGVPVWVYSAEDFKAQYNWFQKYPLQRVDIHLGRARYFTNRSRRDAYQTEMDLAETIINGAMTFMLKPAAATRTDADGKFTLRHHIDGSYVVVSAGSRQLREEKERYRWNVKSEDIAEPLNLLLDNSNMDK